ncbi:MAG: hydantoinase B/oxoprolinase family protein [Lautropia sp.]
MKDIDPVSLGILWDRLVSITEEIQQALVRTSFSTTVRESYDLSCVLFDAEGRSIAQGSYSVPSFIGTAPLTLRHMLERFPADTLQPGDIVATNDPWMGTGHLFDISVMRPVFRRGRRVGYTMSVTHLPDIGGQGWSPTSSEVYQEGLRLPICKLAKAGRLNEELLEIVETNVRTSPQVIGDLMANVACNEVGGRLLVEFMDEYGIDDLAPICEAIIRQSENAMRSQLLALPQGRHQGRLTIEGSGDPIELACAIELGDGCVHIDFGGTSGVVRSGINVPMCYTRAMAMYAIKCLTIPMIPNNEGAVRPISVTAPDDCILNARFPVATAGRHSVGHFVAPLVFGALAEVVPERVSTDSGLTNPLSFHGTHRDGSPVSGIFFCAGGYGAMKGLDGRATTPAPSNMTNVPVEVWENLTSIRIEHKRLLPDSGGAGEFRGGLGQEILLVNDTGHPLTFSCFAGRTDYPARGLFGGRPGALREYRINGRVVPSKSRYVLQPGDRLLTHEAGGGGYGDPRRRARDKVRTDLECGYISASHAADAYGWGEGGS